MQAGLTPGMYHLGALPAVEIQEKANIQQEVMDAGRKLR